ncbi:hypothetical protein BD408DRAFT_232168 [Parasitella parasitica]|nr:hypothetical protein BD408DRAFT_232168 [Parasitella parasitica]
MPVTRYVSMISKNSVDTPSAKSSTVIPKQSFNYLFSLINILLIRIFVDKRFKNRQNLPKGHALQKKTFFHLITCFLCLHLPVFNISLIDEIFGFSNLLNHFINYI